MPAEMAEPRPGTRPRVIVLGLVAVITLALTGGCGAETAPSAEESPAPPAVPAPSSEPRTWPEVSPRPQQTRRIGADLPVPATVRVHATGETDQPTTETVVRVLRAAGAHQVDVHGVEGWDSGDSASMAVVLGKVADQQVAHALDAVGTPGPSPLPAEGYVLTAGRRVDSALLVLAGRDADGLFHAAQTLRQLTVNGAVAGVSVVDYPVVPIRGVVEGFYGRPWSFEDRMDQLAFSGAVKMNTYLYAPKDDPYHREKWREPYPPEEAEKLGRLVQQARANHVRFTFAISPGLSVCYSGANDREALSRKIRAVHALGVRSFSIALDDIYPLPAWSCADDVARYGVLSEATFGQAQADLLNTLQRDLLPSLPGADPLEMVPIQYSEVVDTPYKQALRGRLDRRVRVMWTGTDVLPARISAEDARRAREVWGRKVSLWDNYPTNDFDGAAGRLLLAPYDNREAGAARELAGVLLNPMNQAAASKLPLFTGADFAWNPDGYDPGRSSAAAARYLANGDETVARALLVLVDVEHLAPDWKGDPMRSPAPVLAGDLDRVRAAWAGGNRAGAVTALRATARRLAEAPDVIRGGVAERPFVEDVEPWLTAMTLWATALSHACDGLAARAEGDAARAEAAFREAQAHVARANEIRTRPGVTREPGVVRVADRVLDTFLSQAPAM
ncbi:hyaluronoglucosaminidase [Streptoalloteichus tenebrarius]|uniref:Hyaluronoglucosaminidase n=1 Tax=Streptoalloteichus tenebrarius (strain ATCC 17920 / DSM 40477 / JCM 4838 / CBS 697.72 / NBRC 16177 / NCIMB 11028 / NRRL B-12390 / A12253. 1 / ISP 5477) TaxID=1933 RepID=A0ABT1HUB6_STRSD|nr:beta-N-acetylglucosaminidase domain-containing protein [Streptoalloteichus tenebrarius]MCP2259112.1 hyaluronoglucosaminidase [Streptoalloteichus tenebrarius]BFE99562.1 beta-N-acetylglucosaminidase domain-containing protein [Streptoalloteichus tenebrarius]